MSSPKHTVFVCSATGSQGGALARQLRELDWAVHSTTRNLDSPAALHLHNIGVHLTEGDWDNTEALSASISGCDKLFLCLLPNWEDPSCEQRQCQNILAIARAAGVKQVVASTTLAVSQLDGNARVAPGSFMEKHMNNKKAIEKAVQDAGFEHYTFLRPAFFMANLLEPKVSPRYAELRDRRSWTTSMAPGTRLPVVDHVDIARLAVAAFRDPAGAFFHRRAVGVASDQMRVQEMLDMLAGAAGLPAGSIRAYFKTDEEIEAQANMSGLSSIHQALRTASDYVDLTALRAVVPLTSFKEFLDREEEAVRETYH